MSLAHLIHSVATRDPERTAVLRGEAAVSYGTLAQEVDAAGALLLSRRVQAGDTVALALSQEPSWQWVLLLGALRIGASVVVLGAHPIAQLRVLPGAAPHVVAYRNSTLSRLPGIRPIEINRSELGSLLTVRRVLGLPAAVAADTTAGLILFGGARTSDMVCPIRLDAPLLLARCEQAARQHAFGPTTRLFSALGPANPLALEAVLATWWAGGAVAFALAGETTGVTLARVKPDRVLIAPPLLPGLLTAAGAQAVAGCAQRRLLVAGGPLPLQLARQASRVLAADVRLLLSAPESSLFSIGALQDLETGPGCVGQLVEGAQALAVDAAGNPCNVGEVGALRIRSPLMTDQYLAQPGGAQGALHEGWFVTGLRGHVTAADQRLIITGAEPVAARPAASRERAVQRILTRGEMEAAIGKLPGVDEACVLSLPLPDRRSLPVVVYSSKSGADMKELSTRIGILTLGQTAFHLIRMPALPRDGKGLVLRDQLARQVGAALGALQSGKAKAAGA